MTDRNLKITLGIFSFGLLTTLIVKLTNAPGGMILSGLFLGGIVIAGILIACALIGLVLNLTFKRYSFLAFFFASTIISFAIFHYYLYSPTLKIIVPNGYSGKIHLVASNVEKNELLIDSNGIGYINKWTFEKTYSKPIVEQVNGENLDSNCVGFNMSTFWSYSKFCCIDGKTIKSISFEIERKKETATKLFQSNGFSQYVDTKKLD